MRNEKKKILSAAAAPLFVAMYRICNAILHPCASFRKNQAGVDSFRMVTRVNELQDSR